MTRSGDVLPGLGAAVEHDVGRGEGEIGVGLALLVDQLN